MSNGASQVDKEFELKKLEVQAGYDTSLKRLEAELQTVAADHKAGLDTAAADHKGGLDKTAAEDKAGLDRTAAQLTADLERNKVAWDAEYDRDKVIHDARVELSKSALERARQGAEFVRNAAAAIGTLYTGVLGFAFSVEKAKLPDRGVVPALFLGLSLVLAAAYVAYLQPPEASEAPTPHSSLREMQKRRVNAFADWVSDQVLDRAFALRASVLSLGGGLLFLPAAFLSVSDVTTFIAGGIVALIVLLAALLLK